MGMPAQRLGRPIKWAMLARLAHRLSSHSRATARLPQAIWALDSRHLDELDSRTSLGPSAAGEQGAKAREIVGTSAIAMTLGILWTLGCLWAMEEW